MALEYGWGARKGEDNWHVIKIEEEGNNDTVGVTVCGSGVISKDSGDSVDYSAHPRIGKRCEKCEEYRTECWLDWLDNDSKIEESENVRQVELTRKKLFFFIATRRVRDINKYLNSHFLLISAKFKCELANDELAIISFKCPKLGPQEEIVPVGYFCIITFNNGRVCVGTTPQIPDELVDLIKIGGECDDTTFTLRP
jgi:hypothetical protein